MPCVAVCACGSRIHSLSPGQSELQSDNTYLKKEKEKDKQKLNNNNRRLKYKQTWAPLMTMKREDKTVHCHGS